MNAISDAPLERRKVTVPDLARFKRDGRPIVALTANAEESDETTYLTAGMNGVAQKPIQPDVLLDAIRRAMAGVATEVAEAA